MISHGFSFLVNIALSDPKTYMGFKLMNHETLCWVTSKQNGHIYVNTWKKSGCTQLAASLPHIPKFTITTGVLKSSKWQTVAGGRDAQEQSGFTQQV